MGSGWQSDDYTLLMGAAKLAHQWLGFPGEYKDLVSTAWFLLSGMRSSNPELTGIHYPAGYLARAVSRAYRHEHRETWQWDALDENRGPLDALVDECIETETMELSGVLLQFQERRLRGNRLERAKAGLEALPEEDALVVKDACALGYALVKQRAPPKKRYPKRVRELAELFRRLYFAQPSRK